MKTVRSVCTNMPFPGSRKDLEMFRHTAEFLAEQGIRTLEFYHDGLQADRIGAVLADYGLTGIVIGVIPSKDQKLALCATENWQSAARYYCSIVDYA